MVKSVALITEMPTAPDPGIRAPGALFWPQLSIGERLWSSLGYRHDAPEHPEKETFADGTRAQ
jgi:hypothetical protein